MTTDQDLCGDVEPDWDMQCWMPFGHSNPRHRGGNWELRRMGWWQRGVAVHMERMPARLGRHAEDTPNSQSEPAVQGAHTL